VDLSLDNPLPITRKCLIAALFRHLVKMAEKSGMAVNKMGKIRDGVARSLITAT
jgi:hypothetical protein